MNRQRSPHPQKENPNENFPLVYFAGGIAIFVCPLSVSRVFVTHLYEYMYIMSLCFDRLYYILI